MIHLIKIHVIFSKEQDNYEDADCQDVEDEEGGNEVEIIEDSSEVLNQNDRSMLEDHHHEEIAEPAQPEATSSGTDGTYLIKNTIEFIFAETKFQ